MLPFFKTIFRLILDEVCIISTRYSVSFSVSSQKLAHN